MAHIHTNPGEHDHTASAFIIRTDTVKPKLLLHKHKTLGVFLQPGGHIELSETPWQAVCHEIIEETGYELSQLQILQPKVRMKDLSSAVLHPIAACTNTHNFDSEGIHRHTDEGYAFITTSDPLGKPDEGESLDMQWVSLNELTSLDSREIYANVREIGEYLLTVILDEWEAVDMEAFEK